MPFAWEMLAASGTLGDPRAMFGHATSGPKVGTPVGPNAGVIMIIDFTGKRAIVSGSTLGIGFAIAQGLAASGATVVINGPSQKSVDVALSRLAEMVPKVRVEGIAADLSGPDGVAAFVARARETDILVNNLGIFEPKPFDTITDADWQRLFETNVMSGVRLSRHYLPEMVKSG